VQMEVEMTSIHTNTLYNEDCLETMGRMPDGFVNLVLTDPPYGATQNQWDQVTDFMDDALRISNLVVLTAMQPYSSMLITKYGRFFRYEWIWHKSLATGFFDAKRRPLRAHEQILVFSRGHTTYNPQKTTGHKPVNSYTKHRPDGSNYGVTKLGISGGGSTERYPRSVISFKTDKQLSNLHPTQKPLELFKYLVRTYSNEGDTVYDPFIGSGTTIRAAVELGRNYIGSEISKEYFQIAEKRLTGEANHAN
jgi:DNA modification methylase